MHPRLTELVAYITAQRTALQAAVDQVPEVYRGRRVSADSWSVAEILEHLYRVENGIARLVARSVERARSSGLGAEHDHASLMESLDTFRLVQGRPRMIAPDAVAPRGELSAEAGLAALEGSRQRLLAAVESGDGLALAEITQPHPILGVLNLYQWVLFVGQHEARHAAQVSNIGRTLGRAEQGT